MQTEALDILKTGSNVYLTGCAGSGKTYVLTQYMSYLRRLGRKVGVTASTGIAATQLSGMTIHSFTGIGIKGEITDRELGDLLKRRYMHQRFQHLKTLIIDEVSMLSPQLLENIDKVCRAFKISTLPFGGMQIVLSGDFFQLPPVEKNTDRISLIYQTSAWDDLNLAVCYLDKPYRHTDERFLSLLTEIRTNTVSKQTWETLKERFLDPITPGMTPTRLFTHNVRADKVNMEELAKLKGEQKEFYMDVSGNEVLSNVLKKSCLAPEKLILKERALVMFVKNNFEVGYANGTMGRVISFTPGGFPIVQTFTGEEITVKPTIWRLEEEGEEIARVIQLPLRLAWAITIHKSQGMTLDAAEIDLGKSFVWGMGYVALSRVKTLEGLRLVSINPTALKVNESVIAFDKKLRQMSQSLVQDLRSGSRLPC